MEIREAKLKRNANLGPPLGLARYLTTDKAQPDRKPVDSIVHDGNVVVITVTSVDPLNGKPRRIVIGVPFSDFEMVRYVVKQAT